MGPSRFGSKGVSIPLILYILGLVIVETVHYIFEREDSFF